MPQKAAGRTKVQPTLVPLPADRFYAGIKRKSGPKRKLLSQKLGVGLKRVDNPYRSYSVSDKLQVLSSAKVHICPLYLMRHVRDGGQNYQTPVDVWVIHTLINLG